MSSTRDIKVYDERIGDLVPGLRKFSDSLQQRPDGRFVGRATLEPEEARPLVRALKRAEAELLLEEADKIQGEAKGRRADQRQADALLRIVTAMAAAASAHRASPPEPFRLPPPEGRR